jgi:DNA-binding GntR family transcriptional regulator
MLPERFKPGCLEHLDIVDAVMEGDAARARTFMADHIDNVKLSILQKLQQM